jgi:hypothetical protein
MHHNSQKNSFFPIKNSFWKTITNLFFSSMLISSNLDKFKWEVVNVYGPVQLERKTDFLNELTQKVSSMCEPFIIGGDFNMIRFTWEKSSGNTNQVWMDAFNDFVRNSGVKKMMRKANLLGLTCS